MNSITLRAGTIVGLFLITPVTAAHDLVLQDTKVISVSPCDRQLRLTVRHDSAGHKHLAGKTASGPYRVEIYSLNRKKKILDLPVDEHDQAETLFFVVPSSKLSCDQKIKITIDADNAVTEVNEKNNIGIEKLVRPQSSGLIQTCPIDPEQCK